MKKAGSTYELGRAAFAQGKLKFSDDERVMVILEKLSTRDEKRKEIDEWKKGWAEAKSEAEAPVEEAPKKKKKKTTKKKVSKKK